jgi:hypothetical protein
MEFFMMHSCYIKEFDYAQYDNARSFFLVKLGELYQWFV